LICTALVQSVADGSDGTQTISSAQTAATEWHLQSANTPTG